MTASSVDPGLLGRRMAAVERLVGSDETAMARVAAAPPGYLLVHDSGDLARHTALLATAPLPDEVRTVVTPGRRSKEWHLDVVAHDRPGLLADTTAVLAAEQLSVIRASAPLVCM